MTTLWFAGAENPSHHGLFEVCDVDRVAFNVASWKRNYETVWQNDLPTRAENFDWVAWSDSFSTSDDLVDAIEAMGSHPGLVVATPDSDWADHPAFFPLWDGEGPLTPSDQGVWVTDQVFSDKALLRRVFAAKKREQLAGAITGSSRHLERFDHIITNAWWQTNARGETQIWDGVKFWRFNSTNKTENRSQYAEAIERLGVNSQLVIEDDAVAVGMLALKSWLAYEAEHLDTVPFMAVAEVSEVDDDVEPEPELPTIRSTALARGGQSRRHVLPVIDAFMETTEDPSGGVVEEKLKITSRATTLRQCDNCFLSMVCPAYEAQHECAYEIPVELTSKDQIGKTLQAVNEIQIQRLLFAVGAEQMQGQELQPEVGREMDRAVKLLQMTKEIMDDRESLRLTVEGKGGGVLSKLFGAGVGQNAAALTQPINSDDVLDAIELP